MMGVGLRGQDHLDLLLRRTDVEVVAICDIDDRMLTASKELIPTGSATLSIAGTLSRNSSFPSNIESLVTSSIDRAIETLNAKLADLPTQASLAEVRASLETVKERVVKIAEQPMPGGPVLNASVVEKRLATDPPQHQTAEQQRQSYGAVYEAIRNLANQGGLDTTDKQVDAMAAGLAAQRGGR